MTPESQRTFFLVAAAAAVGIMMWTRPQRPVYPPKNSINRIFTTIQSPDELNHVLTTPAGVRGNLYLGFVRLGEEKSNKLAQSLWSTMAKTKFDTSEDVGAVCIELDGGRNDELTHQYIVNKVPSIVRLHKGILTDDRTEEVDAEKLRKWVVDTLQ